MSCTGSVLSPHCQHALTDVRPGLSALSVVGALRGYLKSMLERQRQRRALLSLDDRLLRDVGITRQQASEEGVKPFWR
jgi:uncharacterized protein YjiS (DUF1127 family)